MDNNRFVLVSMTQKVFELAVALAFQASGNDVAHSWWVFDPESEDERRDFYSRIHDTPEEELGVVDKPKFLVFSTERSFSMSNYSHEMDERHHAFPAPISPELAARFAWDWLQQQDFGQEPGHDGSNDKGFILFNDPWGHVGHDDGAIIAVGPAWAMQGK